MSFSIEHFLKCFLQNQRLAFIRKADFPNTTYICINKHHTQTSNSNITFPGLITAPDRVHGNA